MDILLHYSFHQFDHCRGKGIARIDKELGAAHVVVAPVADALVLIALGIPFRYYCARGSLSSLSLYFCVMPSSIMVTSVQLMQ